MSFLNRTLKEENTSYTEISGAIHIHTKFSDGGMSIADIISPAQETGLDFIIITDHMTLKGKDEGFEGWYNNLLLIAGYEHNDIHDRNHYLAIGTDVVIREQNHPQKYIDMIKNAGGIGFLAHPAEERHYFSKYPSYPWTEWDVDGYDGIEIWNQMSEWVENLKSWGSYIQIFYPRRFIHNAPSSLLAKWDSLNRKKFISGIGGVDAHTYHFGKGIFSYKIFPIKVELKGIRTHLYLQNSEKSETYNDTKKRVLNALKNGNGYISYFKRGDAYSTKIFIKTKDRNIIFPGLSSIKPDIPCKLIVSIPHNAEIHIIKNGKRISKSRGRYTEFEIKEPGLYRVEIFKGNNAWIYSNPFPVGSYPLY